jgi:signal peptidase I
MRSVDELASQVLRRGRCLRIKARGGSMTPFLRDGDVALVAPAEAEAIRVGDVICYETAPGRLFLHRVVARQGARVVARGDALTSTAVISVRRVLGTVRAIERQGRTRRLDTRAARWRSRVVAFLSPALSRAVLLAIGVRRLVRAVLRD